MEGRRRKAEGEIRSRSSQDERQKHEPEIVVAGHRAPSNSSIKRGEMTDSSFRFNYLGTFMQRYAS
jgi:hypothetical protein